VVGERQPRDREAFLEDLRDQHDADVGRDPAVEEAQRDAEGLL
jgi:hypothetical protein